MKRILAVTLLLVLFYSGKSQDFIPQKPDYDLISREIKDSTSNFYYPKLMSRLVAYDTTLNVEDYRRLYYGYIFDKDYQPYRKFSDEKKLTELFNGDNFSEKDYDEVIKLATSSINEFPFDLRSMNIMAFVYHLKGDEEMAKKISYRLHGTFGAILTTGDGKSCETGFHVISVSHEYVFLNMFQLRITEQYLTGNCDYLVLEKDERNIEGIYFNIEKMLAKNLERFKEGK